MRRGAKLSKPKVKAKPPGARKSLKDGGSRVRDLEKHLAEALQREAEALKREAEALEQQTATAEILRAISGSLTDVQPVFDAIVDSARRLLDGHSANVLLVVEGALHLAALTSTGDVADAAVRANFPAPMATAGVHPHVINTRRPYVVTDTETDPLVTENIRSTAPLRGYRSMLFMPLIRDEQAIGLISVTRRSVGTFSDNEIGLLKTFADQAVIAIENVRLFNETKEALEQQTATSEILGVISSSPTDVQPVLDVVAENAAKVCGASDAIIFRAEGDLLRRVAHFLSVPVSETPDSRHIDRESLGGRVVIERTSVQIADISDEMAAREFPETARHARRVGHRTLLGTPLMREGVAIGVIVILRTEVRPFTARQVALLETFADQAVIAIENVRLFKELEARNRDLTATSEVLQVISRSPTEVQPVFTAIAKSAAHLIGAVMASVYEFDGSLIHLRVVAPDDWPHADDLRRNFPTPPARNFAAGRVILDRAVLHRADLQNDPDTPELTQALAGRMRLRGVLWVPMLRGGEPVGVIGVAREESALFSDEQVRLLQTFADQAVIAIENVRLFTELQASNRELMTALDTQTATSDILRVISRSQTDVQPVFDAILRSAVRLLRAHTGALTRIAGDQIALAALTSADDAGDAALRARFPQLLHSKDPHAQVIRARVPLNVADAHTDPRWPGAARAYARLRGYRSAVVVPLLRHDDAIGSIGVNRREPGGFTDDEIALLQTFADQAVIAIENVRLLSELQQKNEALTQAHAQVTEALEQQTATSDILRVISRSQTDVLPVFDTIVRSAVKLCDGLFSGLWQFDGELIHQVAQHNYTPEALEAARRVYPARPTRGQAVGRAILERAVVHIPDHALDPEFELQDLVRTIGLRSGLYVPMLRDGTPIGVIAVARAEPGPFPASEIELLKTFADQAVIAIENARLLSELQVRTQELTHSVEQLTALGDVGRAVSSSLDLETVLTTIVSHAVQLAGVDGGVVFEYDEVAEEFVHRAASEQGGALAVARRTQRIRKGEGVLGQTAITLEPVQVEDISAAGAYESRLRGSLIASGIRGLLAVPIVREGKLIGSLVVSRYSAGRFAPDTVELLRTFATQSALAIQNARLFHEIEIKSQELEVASQHKSEFLASMSHELRTPLNAIIGFSDVLLQRMFGEMSDKQTEYLQDILASGQHLLSLINDILDLSKIEAGRMELDLADFNLPSAIDDALLLMRERAGRRGLALERHVDERLGEIRADERKVKQVLLNLLSNAVKFTPEGGRIEVRATLVDGMAEISVTDTGVGIAPEDHEAVFEEFRQVGKAEKKAEGTGLGLALCRKFVELHGGRIWVKSGIGAGSTFTFALPLSR